MTANQCDRPNLPAPQIYESFSVCSLRSDSQLGDNKWDNAITKCCTTPIKVYQCWNYCGVEESQFSTWLSCIQEATNSTWGAACQRADQSPVLTATGPYPSSYTQPAPPLGYTPPPTYTTSSTSKAPSTSRAGWSVTTNATATFLSLTGGSNGNGSTPVGLASPTAVIQGGSPKALALFMGGMMCGINNTTRNRDRSFSPDDDHLTADFGPSREATAQIYVGPPSTILKLMKFDEIRIQRSDGKPSVVWWDNTKLETGSGREASTYGGI